MEDARSEFDGVDASSLLQFDHVPIAELFDRTHEALWGLEFDWKDDAGADGETSSFTSSRLDTSSGSRVRSLAPFVSGLGRATGKQIAWIDNKPVLPFPWRAAASPFLTPWHQTFGDPKGGGDRKV